MGSEGKMAPARCGFTYAEFARRARALSGPSLSYAPSLAGRLGISLADSVAAWGLML